MEQQSTRRITANLPEKTLQAAMDATGLGITETLVAGLEALLRLSTLEKAKQLQGKIHIQPDTGRKNGSADY